MRVIYYDGYCALCDRFVGFVLARDRQARYRYAPLSGETARGRFGESFDLDQPRTVLLEEPGKIRVRSDAALAILTGLGGVWRLAAVLRIIPRRLRDALYDHVARKRFEWYGRRDACRTPTASEQERFLP